jgi:hypothetical protein
MIHFLHIGGLLAVGFDPTGSYLLTITHSGRGVFRTDTWERVARDYELAYPINGHGIGIGPIDAQIIAVKELDSEHDISVCNPAGNIVLNCSSDHIEVAGAPTSAGE